MVKNGGNVVSYFCTPEGQLLHAVGGPVSGEKLLAEARWARDLALDMQNKSRQSKAEFVRKAHENASRRGQTHSWQDSNRSSQAHVHRLLSQYAYMPMSKVEMKLFRSLSGEKFESNRSEICNASEAFAQAEKRNRPILLVLRSNDQMTHSRSRWQQPSRNASVLNDYKVKRLLKKFEVASFPKIQLVAFSNLKQLEGWKQLAPQAGSGWRSQHTYLVVCPSGKILTQVYPGRPSDFIGQLSSALQLWKEESAKKSIGLVSSKAGPTQP